MCGGLTLAGCQTPTQTLSHSPYSAGQVRENKVGKKSSCFKISIGKSLTNYHHRHDTLARLGKIEFAY